MTQKEFIKYTERMNKNIASLLKGNEEELAFKDRKILANLNAVDLLNIIEFLQDDRRQCLEELSKTHNRSVEIQKENQELKSQLAGTTHCFDEEEHNKLKEEITNLSKDVDMWNAKYNDMFDENQELKLELSGYRQAILNNKEMLGLKEQNEKLKKQVEERPKEYVFIGNAQNKTRDFINQITKDNKEFKTQQKKFINYLEDEKDRLARECSNIYEDSLGHTRLVNADKFDEVNDILQKYRSIIDDDK